MAIVCPAARFEDAHVRCDIKAFVKVRVIISELPWEMLTSGQLLDCMSACSARCNQLRDNLDSPSQNRVLVCPNLCPVSRFFKYTHAEKLSKPSIISIGANVNCECYGRWECCKHYMSITACALVISSCNNKVLGH